MDDNRKDSIGEEVSAFGERTKGNIKEATGTVTGDSSLRAEGATESASGAARQRSNRMVTGLFRDRDSAERAYGSLSTRGYGKDDVNLLMSDETRKKHFSSDDAADTDLGSKALEGLGAGAAIGGTTGAVLAAIAAIGTSVVLPGIGLVVAGPLAAALAGAGAGGATGGLIGALIGSGIPEDRAKVYDEGVRSGGIVMGVNARSDEDAEYFENEFRTHRGENVYR
ncbi:MAG TPA: CsbD family protein [Pyrinomonadaceae bacterium]|nr:CsbD family protein [Pyrinomonadaceae bacterium]